MAFETDLVALAQRIGINTMVEKINATEGVDMTAYRRDYYYSNYMLGKVKIDASNYVYLKYAEVQTIPKGHAQWLAKKNFPLTEHTTPLLEGIPPQSDKIRKEKITGTFHQYGRYMEFSDRIDFQLLDPVVFEYADEYADVALRTMHRLARKELLASTSKYYANQKTSIGTLVVGDTVGLADFRLMALKFSRLAVKPIGRTYKVITSEEHMWDLMTDPLIIAYIGANNGLEQYATGKLPILFNVEFEKTQMDDFAYGYELGNPGEYLDGGSLKVRAMLTFANGYVYGNISATSHRTQYVSSEYKQQSDMIASSSRSVEEGLTNYYDTSTLADGTTIADAGTNNRLADGSWIPIRTLWSFTAAEVAGITTFTTVPAAAVLAANAVQLDDSDIYYDFTVSVAAASAVIGSGTFKLYYKYTDAEGDAAYELIGDTGVVFDETVNKYPALTAARINAVLPAPQQLPVHKAIMLGQEALIRLGIEGEGNVQMFIKEKGSAGVLDPVNQRQSIGFKINTIGFKRLREEASCVFYHVPSQAPLTTRQSLTAEFPSLSW